MWRRGIGVLLSFLVAVALVGSVHDDASALSAALPTPTIVALNRDTCPAHEDVLTATTVAQEADGVDDSPSGESALEPTAFLATPCPQDAVLVRGQYCTEVRHHCLKWLDDEKLPYARCGEYAESAECVGKRVPMSFCIDRYEYTRPGELVPANFMSFERASRLCQDLGKRICSESEWNFACEGEAMLPYPYGWRREPKCNQDRSDLTEMKWVDGERKEVKRDNRRPSTDFPDCVSPFGVYNMVGNLDEPVLREEVKFSPPFRNSLKGGWWMAARNRCRPATTRHDDFYNDVQVGVRCCSDVPKGGGLAG